MKNLYLGLKFAFSYFSILPVWFKKEDDLSDKDVLKYSLLFLPLVGLVIALLISFLFTFASFKLYGATTFIVLFFSVLYMVFYGFLHTEAISDVVDAIYAKHSGKDAYEVIKEPTIGAMGMLYSVSFLILKLAAISYIFYYELIYEFILVVFFSRLMIVYIVKLNEFKSSFVNMLKERLSFKAIILFSSFYLIPLFYLLGIHYIPLLVLSALFALIITLFLKKKLGFLNGDALGFNIEFIELFCFISVIFFNLS
jgi:adenosylcobinamide-GDP ribazoletransferase